MTAMVDSAERTERGITDEKIERLRDRIGISEHWRGSARNVVARHETMSMYANLSTGDDNPLFTDPDYGTRSRWGSMIATPMYVFSMGLQDDDDWTDEQKDIMRRGDPLRGMGAYLSNESWAFVRPVTEGVRLHRREYLQDVQIRESEFGGGRVAILPHRLVYTDGDGVLYAVYEQTYHHADRKASGEKGKYRETKIEPYSEEALAEIAEAYDNEFTRGAEKLLVSDVSVGDELPLMVKGPLTVTDVIAYHVGASSGAMPLKLAHQSSRRKPGFYVKNKLNVADLALRCHWEDEYAQYLGHPAAYDYGLMRTNWVIHYLTNWIGDDGWISRMSSQTRRFNYIGDTQWFRGRVVAIDAEGDAPSVDVTIEGVNQRGETTTLGKATVLVCRADGTVTTLPEMSLNDLPERL